MLDIIPKVVGADIELGGFIDCQRDTPCYDGEGARAARLLLAQFDGLPNRASLGMHPRIAYSPSEKYSLTARYSRNAETAHVFSPPYGRYAQYGESYANGILRPANGFDPQDWGRKYAPHHGGCTYIDLNHLEIVTPEVRSARDFVAYHHANLRLASQACARANALLTNERIVVTANNTDGHGSSWGGHLSVLISKALWGKMFTWIYPELTALAAFQASSIVYTGAGKVGSDNGRAPAPFQLTQRGDFVECLVGTQTTYQRPLVNSRDEPLCGTSTTTDGHARLHCIFFDTCLMPTSTYLKVGCMQIVLAMLEAGHGLSALSLRDPLTALAVWGRDLTLRATAPLGDGREVTAIDLQRLFLEEARGSFRRGEFDEVVPEAEIILEMWQATLDFLERRDWAKLSRKIDWAAKYCILSNLVERGLAWEAPELKHADVLWSSLDHAEGLYFALERDGLVDQVVPPQDIERAMREPPEDTRAYLRAQVLRAMTPEHVVEIDWDRIRLRPNPRGPVWCVDLADPLGATRRECAPNPLPEQLDALLAALGPYAYKETAPAYPASAGADDKRPYPLPKPWGNPRTPS